MGDGKPFFPWGILVLSKEKHLLFWAGCREKSASLLYRSSIIPPSLPREKEGSAKTGMSLPFRSFVSPILPMHLPFVTGRHGRFLHLINCFTGMRALLPQLQGKGRFHSPRILFIAAATHKRPKRPFRLFAFIFSRRLAWAWGVGYNTRSGRSRRDTGLRKNGLPLSNPHVLSVC